MSIYTSVQKRIRDHILTPCGVRHVSGPPVPRTGVHDVTVLSLVRDEEYLLQRFLEHYRNIGARHFVFMNNGSVDGTRPLLQEQHDCTILETSLSYKYYKVFLRRYMLRTFGANRWCLVVDADEFFDYPFSNTVSLESLVAYLNRYGYTAVHTPMLDMFSCLPSDQWEGRFGASFDQADYPSYDLKDISGIPLAGKVHPSNTVSNTEMQHYMGGIRKSYFGADTTLTKFSLIKYGTNRIQYRTDHQVRNAALADFSGVLLHYKLTGTFKSKTTRFAKEKVYWRDSVWYRKALERMESEPTVKLPGGNAFLWESAAALVDQGYLHVSDRYLSDLVTGGFNDQG